MRLSKLGMALTAVLAIAAVTASSASAGTVTQASTWKVGKTGTALKSGESRPEKCHLEEEGAGGKAKLNAEMFGGLVQVEMTATGIECVEATINQATVGGQEMAEAGGKIRFTGVSVMEPAECTVPSTLTTNKLKTKIEMHSGSGAEGEIVFDRFEPETGNVFIEIPFSNCALAGNQPLEGSVYGQSGLKTGERSTQQTPTFSPAVNTTAGGSLQIGGEPASLTANVINELATGEPFGVNSSSTSSGTVTQASVWKVGKAGTALKSGESRAAKCHLENEGAGGKATLNAQMFGGLIQVELTATGIECVEATINQATVGGVEMAEDAGKIRFTGVSVMTPAECTVPSTLTTNKLKTKIEMHSGSGAEGEIVFDRFEPETGNVFFELPFSNCALSGNQPLEGSFYGRAALNTGERSAQQTLTVSPAVNTTAGGSLQIAGEPASLTAKVINELTTGEAFGVN